MNIDNLMEANNMEESLKTADKQCPRIVNADGVDDDGNELAIVLASEHVRCPLAVKESLIRLGDYDVVTNPDRQAEYRFCPGMITSKQCFRWNRQVVQQGVEKMSDEIILPTPDTMTYILQLKTSKDKWRSWIEVRPSNIKNAGLGLFATTHFLKDQLITWFWGETLEKGAQYPTDDEYHIKLDKRDIINTTPSDPSHKLLGLGAHFMNDPRWVPAEVRNSPTYVRTDPDPKEVNAKFLSNGMVVATKRIDSGTEIVIDYRTGMHPRAFDGTWSDVDASRMITPNLDQYRAQRVNTVFFEPKSGNLRFEVLRSLFEVGRIVNHVETPGAAGVPPQTQSSDLRFEMKVDLKSQCASKMIKTLEVEGFINEEHDVVEELSILLGGTVHQTLHRDVCCVDEKTQCPAERDRSILLPGRVGDENGGFALGIAKGAGNKVSVVQAKRKLPLPSPKLYLRHSSLPSHSRIEVIDNTLEDRFLAWFPFGLSFHGSIFHAGAVLQGKKKELMAFDKAIKDDNGMYAVNKTVTYLHRRKGISDIARIFVGVRQKSSTSRTIAKGKVLTLGPHVPNDADGNGEGRAFGAKATKRPKQRKRGDAHSTNDSAGAKKRKKTKKTALLRLPSDKDASGAESQPMEVQSQALPVRRKRRCNPSRAARPGTNPADITDLVSDEDDTESDQDQ